MFTTNASDTLARPALLPDSEADYGLPVFTCVEEALASYRGDDPIYVLYPQRIAKVASEFVETFQGKTLYAVKANPHPAVLTTLWAAGVRAFDVASLREVELVVERFPDAEIFLMHPVKSRKTIARAYQLGVRHFAFDSFDELQKIKDETSNAPDLTLHLRLTLEKSTAAMPLTGKFGAGFEEATDLLVSARKQAAKLGVCFHVGSQCMDPQSFDSALSYVRRVLDAAQVDIDVIDIGGGFPSAYPGMTPPPMTDYFRAIEDGLEAYGFAHLDCLAEPGRLLVAEGGSTLARVDLRRGSDLYLNEGSYGSLFDAAMFDWTFPVRLHRTAPVKVSETIETYRFFGPTCDSLDTMNGPFPLPACTGEGDWIEIEHLGAYGQTLATRFNGFASDTVIAVLT